MKKSREELTYELSEQRKMLAAARQELKKAEWKLDAHKDKLKSHAIQLIEQLLEDSSEQSICKVKALILKALEVLKEDVKKRAMAGCNHRQGTTGYVYRQGRVEAQLNILRTLCEAIHSHSKFLPALKELADTIASDEYFEKYWNKTLLHWVLVQHNFFCTLGNSVLDGKILVCIFDDLEAALISS